MFGGWEGKRGPDWKVMTTDRRVYSFGHLRSDSGCPHGHPAQTPQSVTVLRISCVRRFPVISFS